MSKCSYCSTPDHDTYKGSSCTEKWCRNKNLCLTCSCIMALYINGKCSYCNDLGYSPTFWSYIWSFFWRPFN